MELVIFEPDMQEAVFAFCNHAFQKQSAALSRGEDMPR